MKFLYYLIIIFLSLTVCNKVNLLKQNPYIALQYPFKHDHSTYCSQGNINIEGSHSHDNILYAVDFLTPPSQKAGIIHAAHSGIAYVYDKCNFRANDYKSYNANECGSGYGNHVRILSPDGYLTIYAHLSYITVKHKSYVKTGDKIGIEGISGNAGKRHLHFGLHFPKNIQMIEKQPGYTGLSIPFNMKFKINNKSQTLSSLEIPCSNDLTTALLKGA